MHFKFLSWYCWINVSAALYPTQALKSPTILQTPVKAPRIRQIQSLNIISSPRMSSFNVISGGRAPSPDSSISDESLQGVSLTPSRKLMPAPKKRKSSGLQLDFSSSTKKSRTSASANERSHHSMENIATDTGILQDCVWILFGYLVSHLRAFKFLSFTGIIDSSGLILTERIKVIWNFQNSF